MAKSNKPKLKDREPSKASRRRVTPIFHNPQATRILGISDALLIDIERILKAGSKRPQKATDRFKEKLTEDMLSQFSGFTSLPASEKVLRWNGAKSLVDHAELSSLILEKIFGLPDWIIRIPLEGDVPEVLKCLPEAQRERIHIGFNCQISSKGAWEASATQSEEAHNLGFKIYAILEYNRPDAKYAKAALELPNTLKWLRDLQLDILPDSKWSSKSGTPEDIARSILQAFRTPAGEATTEEEGADLRPLSVKYSAVSADRPWWIAHFAAPVADPLLAFAEYFEKPQDQWSEEDKTRFLDLLKDIDSSLKAKLQTAHALYRIRVLKPGVVDKEVDEEADKEPPSFVKACKAIWQIEKSQVYRLLKAGEFLHLLEVDNVPKEKWPIHETHIRNLLASKMKPKQRVECWKKIKEQYPGNRLTAKHINQDVDAALIEQKLPPVSKPSVDTQKKVLKSLGVIVQRVESQFPDDPQAINFVSACRSFLKHFEKEEASDSVGNTLEEPVQSKDEQGTVLEIAPSDSTEPVTEEESKEQSTQSEADRIFEE